MRFADDRESITIWNDIADQHGYREMGFTPDQIRLMEVFFPHALKRQIAAESQGTRFVHYTSAEAAVNVLRTKEVWMRKTSCMDDFREVEHGLECLFEAYASDEGQRLKAALESVFNGICDEIETLFNGWVPYFRTDTYILCVSEHDDSEDPHGRLSMWRAYGESTGVALVMLNRPFLSPSNALKAYTSPVAYLTNQQLEEEIGKIASAVESNSDFLRATGRTAVVNSVFSAFRFAVLCTKHPGFHEEREWRVVYCPTLEKSDHLIKEVQVIGGTPQPIYKIPLRNIPEEGFVGAEIPELLDRIIIGPTQYPSAAFDAFLEMLSEAGVPDPANRIFLSDIPIR